MLKKFLYFQPEYVGKFKCDGSKCNARCCKGWDIIIDEKTFQRYSRLEGDFIVRSLTKIICVEFKRLTAKISAQMILFGREPLTFELKEIVQDDALSIGLSPMPVPEKFLARLIDIQIAMISILQERTLSIDQRLIVLGFFFDKLEEISAGSIDDDALTKLIAAYESKSYSSG